MSWVLADLPWLVRKPEDFAARCARAAGETDPGHALRRLAGHALDPAAAKSLARALVQARARADGRRPSGLEPLRLAVVGNATAGMLIPNLVAAGIRHGFAFDVLEGPLGQLEQQAFDSASAVGAFRPQAILLALDHRAFPDIGHEDAPDAAHMAVERLIAAADAFHANTGAVIVFQTLAAPPEPLFGSLDARLSFSRRAQVQAFNRILGERLADRADLLLDIGALAEAVGVAAWYDPTYWNLGKFANAPGFDPLVAEHVGRLLGAWRGRSRKCLVLDLDNTVWGGVVGDDGIDGIVLGQGDHLGEAFLAVQRYALDLSRRGILLAVCSKNEESVARRPFDDHPEMLLRTRDITAFVANWQDKATNLEAIARSLDIGIDSLVFLDDNPAERDLVRRELPMVAVPELPDDPSWYVRTLAMAGYFEAIAYSDEDRQRVEQYRANAERKLLIESSRDLDDYLRSLDMVATFSPFTSVARPRIAQLINKSNQFNLTTRRYSETDVAAFERDPTIFTLQTRLNDRFGDNGIISVLICRKQDTEWEIDTWLMSCRVLGRQVEQAVLAHLAEAARNEGASALIGRYVPTVKNSIVRDHYSKLGFTPAGGDGYTWRLDLADFRAADIPVAVRSNVERITE